MTDNPGFIHGLDDPTIQWRFDLIGEGVFIGFVVDHILQTNGTPITIRVKSLKDKEVEIPWTAIQTITFEGE